MTHPDIINTEAFGSRNGPDAQKLGECVYCENDVYDDSGDAVVSNDGLFCDMDCCCEYYEIRRL
ncbi:MAG: hypothetical protein IJA16_03655 [Clostridia bacterium]|nr:hypothetical protein [Clostridia bacterium]